MPWQVLPVPQARVPGGQVATQVQIALHPRKVTKVGAVCFWLVAFGDCCPVRGLNTLPYLNAKAFELIAASITVDRHIRAQEATIHGDSDERHEVFIEDGLGYRFDNGSTGWRLNEGGANPASNRYVVACFVNLVLACATSFCCLVRILASFTSFLLDTGLYISIKAGDHTKVIPEQL